jgi:hypothetical protein
LAKKSKNKNFFGKKKFFKFPPPPPPPSLKINFLPYQRILITIRKLAWIFMA